MHAKSCNTINVTGNQKDTVIDIISWIINHYKTTPTNMPYMSSMGLKVKGKNKSKTNCRQNWMIYAINLRQDATCQEYTEVEPSF